MTTTAVRTPRAVTSRRGTDVMSEYFNVSAPRSGLPPRREDACRVGIMRRIAAARLRYCGLGAITDDVMLIVSELVTNAVLHSGTRQIGLEMAVDDGFLDLTVIDGMPGVATLKDANDEAESGRGLALVQMVVEERGGAWGTRDGGATTWCRLPVPEEAKE